MKQWFNQYKLYLRKTWLVSLAGFLILLGLIVRELGAVYVGISMYEQPSLPSEIWWNVFYAAANAVSIVILLVVRLFILRRHGYSTSVFGMTLAIAICFVINGYLTPPASADSFCDSVGRCFGIYVLERQDWIDAAALLFFPGSLLRSSVTAIVAAFASKSSFE